MTILKDAPAISPPHKATIAAMEATNGKHLLYKPRAIDLSRHINTASRARSPSPLKDIIKYMYQDGMISLAGGLPHPSLFPFQDLTVSAYKPETVLNPLSPETSPVDTDLVVVGRETELSSGPLILQESLQYTGGTGDRHLTRWAREFTATHFQPAYEDFDILLTTGNTDAWSKCVGLLCEPGDYVLCEEHTYPSAQALWAPLGCRAAPVAMDGGGVRADLLDIQMSEWLITHPGEPKPHVLYVVPVGSNPAGATIGAERRKAIYDVCVRHDIIIVEDDPYYFLQFPEFEIGKAFMPSGSTTVAEYKKTLVPSFLKYDYQGRVIRLDTWSKTLAPGNRLGYFVANSFFKERLLRATEVETQAPAGWSQAIVGNLLFSWGVNGYLQWCANLRDQYRARRDWMCNAIAKNFEVEPASNCADRPTGAEGFIAFMPSSYGGWRVPVFSFVAPTAGMFVWARFYLKASPRFCALARDTSVIDPEDVFQDEIWRAMIEQNVLLTPGSYFTPWQGRDKVTTKSRGGEPGIGYFRLAFSTPSKLDIEKGIVRMSGVLKRYWE